MPELMPDRRYRQLMKAAEETIELSNIGVDSTAALAKVARDADLNDHEVELVAHAVNNSTQLAYLQSEDPNEREAPFPLVDAEKAKEQRDQPATNADENTGDRYGNQETPSQSAEDRFASPDSLEIQERVRKEAELSYLPERFIHPVEDDHARILREGWGLEKAASAQLRAHQDPHAVARKLSSYCQAVEEARTRAASARHDCETHIRKISEDLRRLDVPDWSILECAALGMGADAQVLDLIYKNAGLAELGVARADLQKQAQVRQINPREAEFARRLLQTDALLEKAAEAVAVYELCTDHAAQAERQLLGIDQLEKEAQSAAAAPFISNTRVDAGIDPGELGKQIGEAPATVLPTREVLMGALMDPASDKPETATLPYSHRQDVANIGSRAHLESLMRDDYVGGHELPEVIEAYNQAMSVNPTFSRAELISYVRQHLATKGAVPLDLQLRAHQTPDVEELEA